MRTGSAQAGVTLIEVLVALLVLSVGVSGVALLQLNALKNTDSALRSTLVSFIAQDLLERARANPDANYALHSLSDAPTSANPESPRDLDLFDFADQLKRKAGKGVEASIAVTGAQVTVTVEWNDARAQRQPAQRQTLTLSSLVAPGKNPP